MKSEEDHRNHHRHPDQHRIGPGPDRIDWFCSINDYYYFIRMLIHS